MSRLIRPEIAVLALWAGTITYGIIFIVRYWS